MKRVSTSCKWIWVATVFAGVTLAFAYANAQTTTPITTEMGPGQSGAQVSALQTFLAADPSVYPEGLVTGYYGNLTTTAVQHYQCKYGIVCQGSVSATGYGRVGPATLAKIEEQQGTNPGGGTTVPPVGYPSTLDVNAPVIGTPTVTVTGTTATFHWATNEPAHSRVMYGTFWPFLYASAPSVADGSFDTSSDVTLSGLQPNTKYYYVLESVDAVGNLQWSLNGFNNSFTTGA